MVVDHGSSHKVHNFPAGLEQNGQPGVIKLIRFGRENMNKLFLSMIIFGTLFLLAACGRQPAETVSTPAAATALPQAATLSVQPVEKTAPQSGNVSPQIANPASKNCIDKGGKLDIRTDSSGGQFGMCVFPNGKTCEEWALMRGQCSSESGAVASALYHNAAYGFDFNYPPSWQVQESPAAAGMPLTVRLTNGNNTLRLQVKRPADKTSLEAEAPQGGEISQQERITVLGRTAPVQVVKLEGKLKSAAVNLDTGNLLLRFQLDNSADSEIPASVMIEAETIISSLKLNQ
jgi:uncharacterized protein